MTSSDSSTAAPVTLEQVHALSLEVDARGRAYNATCRGNQVFIVRHTGEVVVTKGGELLGSRSEFVRAPTFHFKARLRLHERRREVLAANEADALALRALMSQHMSARIAGDREWGFYESKRDMLTAFRKQRERTKRQQCIEDIDDDDAVVPPAKVARPSLDITAVAPAAIDRSGD